MSNTLGTKPAEHPTVRGRVLVGRAAYQHWQEAGELALAKGAAEQVTVVPETEAGKPAS